MKNIFKLICFILLFAILLSLTAAAGNTTVLSYNTLNANSTNRLLCDGNNAYLVGINNKQVNIESVFPKTFSITLNLPNKPHYYNLFGDNLVLVCASANYDQTQFVIYDITDDVIETVDILEIYINDENDFVFSNNYLYIINNDRTVYKFSKTGKQLSKITPDVRLTSLSCDKSGNIYATASNGLYKLYSNNFQKISDTACYPTINFINNNLFTDSYGRFYNIYNNSLSIACAFRNSSNLPSGGEYGNHLIYADGNQLFAVSKTNGKRIKTKELNNYIEQFCVINGTTIALVYSNDSPMISLIPFDDYDEYKETENTPGSSTNNPSVDNGSGIYSEVYVIDNVNYKILKSAPTTIAKFKKNMHYNGYNVVFTRFDGKVVKSGNIGTGTIARFYNENASYEYELSVIGDLTGEGNVNSRDKKLLFDAVLGNVTLDGVYYESANLHTENNDLTVTDIIMLMRMIKYGIEYIQ